jgi:twitching motility protein PilT
MTTTATKTIDILLRKMMEKTASDLHLAVGSPPIFRIDGKLIPENSEPLSSSVLQEMIYSILDFGQREKFEKEKELDFSYSVPGLSRFRGNILLQRGTMGAVFRAIPPRALSLKELGFTFLEPFCLKPRGLVLVTGPTGSGKSTTLAAMIDYINETQAVHIVTIEDPIEFLHKNKKSIIRQRELGSDTLSFANALKHVLRQDPDVILVGEMRDLETIALAITAAETGHLVFGTLHTTGAAQTVDRIVDVFPPHQQQQIRIQLSGILEGIISQTLLPKASGSGRVCAMEILVATPAIRSLIREGKNQQIPSMIQTGGQLGMQSLDTALKNLVQNGIVTFEEAMAKASNPEEFKRLLGR